MSDLATRADVIPYWHCTTRPIAFKKGTNNEVDEALTADPYPTWQKLEELVDKGKVRNIGVSKYDSFPLAVLGCQMLTFRQLQHCEAAQPYGQLAQV